MKKQFILVLLSVLSVFCFGQSADKITEIIKSKTVTYGQAGYLCVTAAGLENDDVSEIKAKRVLLERGIISSDRVMSDDAITVKEFAWVCANTWNVKGSLMSKIFKAPRYAFRQMKADSVIPAEYDPDRKISGREALNIVTDCIDKYLLITSEAE